MTWGGYKCGEEITRWDAAWGENKAVLRKIIKKQLFRGWENLESSKTIRDWMELADGKLGPVFTFIFIFTTSFFTTAVTPLQSQSKCSPVGWHQAARLVLVIHQNKQLWGHPKPQGCSLQYDCSTAVGAASPEQPQTRYHQLKPSRAQCSKPSSAPSVTINVSFKGPWLCLWGICPSTGARAGSRAVAEVLSLSSNAPVYVGHPGRAFTKAQECSEETVYTFPHSWDHVCYILCTSYIGKQLGQPWIPLLCLDTTSWVLPPPNHRQAGAK